MKFKALAVFAVIAQISHAEMTLSWSTNLLTIAPIDWSDSHIREFSDESFAILSGSNPKHLYIFDQNGSVIYNDSFTADDYSWSSSFIAGGRSSARFYVKKSYSGAEELRIYEKSGNAYSVTNIAIAETDSHSIFEETTNDGNVLYLIRNNILEKYTFSETPVFLSNTIAMGISNSNFMVSWQSNPDALYQIQASSDLTDWTNIGQPITGTGAIMNWSSSVSTSNAFFRVLIQ